MKKIIALGLALLCAAPAFAQSASPSPGCTIVSTPKPHYACMTATGASVPVSKAWFKAHKVYTYGPDGGVPGGASADAFAVAAAPGEKLATPPGLWHKVLVVAGTGALGVLFIYAMAQGGGGAFAG